MTSPQVVQANITKLEKEPIASVSVPVGATSTVLDLTAHLNKRLRFVVGTVGPVYVRAGATNTVAAVATDSPWYAGSTLTRDIRADTQFVSLFGDAGNSGAVTVTVTESSP